MVQENEDFGSHFEDGLAVPRRAISLAWPIVLIAAIAIHHVTGSPIAAASLLAIHAGWKSFRCGLWLKSADPVASRGWACFWFYLATAFWRAAAWACGVILGFLVLAIWTGRPPSDREVMVELCTLVGGVFLSTAAGIVAITFALSGKVSVWVQPDVREQCCGDSAIRRYWRVLCRRSQPRVQSCDLHCCHVTLRTRLRLCCIATGVEYSDWPAA